MAKVQEDLTKLIAKKVSDKSIDLKESDLQSGQPLNTNRSN